MLKRFFDSFAKAGDRFNDNLDRYILPWPVRFLTFRFVILATIALLIPLIVFASNTVLVLAINSYLNTMSVAVSSIVLLYATISEARQKQIAQMQEKRAQEDHEHVTEMHRLVLEELQNQDREMESLRQLLQQMQGKAPAPEAAPAAPVDLETLHPRGKARFEDDDVAERLQADLHHNELVTAIRSSLRPGD